MGPDAKEIFGEFYQPKFFQPESAQYALKQLTQADYLRTPVKIEQFIDDPYYMGGVLQGGNLFPQVRQDLIDLFDGEWSEVVLAGAIGWGKCLNPKTLVLMFDGTIKQIEDVCKGELLMGPDSKPRRILSVRRGNGPMYRVNPIKGDSFECNGPHILPLKLSPRKTGQGHADIEMTAEDFLARPVWFRKNMVKLWKPNGIDFEDVKTLEIDPYFLGVWLGDGSKASAKFEMSEFWKAEILEWLRNFKSEDVGISERLEPRKKKTTIISFSSMNKSLRELNLLNNKHVPQQYKTASRQARLGLLAGLIDTDGELRSSGGKDVSGYRYSSVIKQLSEDFAFVARSLGFAAYIHEKKKACQTGATAIAYEVEISGDVDQIPCKVKRKRAPKRRQKKNPLYVGFDIEPIGDGEYIGIELDGDGRFLLGDFTVTHNTTMAYVGICYDLYLVSCLRSPAKKFGLIPGTGLAFLNVSVNVRQALKILFGGINNLIKSSPYFQEKFPPEKNIKTEIRFPRSVSCYPVAANEQAILGEGVFSAVFDEMNFYKITENSSLNPDGGTYDQAVMLYNRMSRRIRSRMNQRGRLPGHLWMVSSSRYPNDFTERKKLEAVTDPNIFVREYAAWETKPTDSLMKETFRVEVGDVRHRTRVLVPGDENIDMERVITVPMDYRDEFVKDPDGSVRDYAGISILSTHPFIGKREKIQAMFDRGAAAGLKHPFTAFTVTLQDARESLLAENLHWIKHIERQYGDVPIEKNMLANGPYYGHVDLAKTQDACGFVVGHVVGSVQVERGIGKDRRKETRPIIRIDLALQIVAPPQGEIDIAKVRGLFYQLRDLGMQFGMISYDSWGSEESIQALKSEGFEAEVFSVDIDPGAYQAAKDALYDDRIVSYEMPILRDELATVMIDMKKNKVDHPPHGCFTGETRIALLDGTCPTFKELGERYGDGTPFWVYSMGQTGVRPGLARNPRITKNSTQIVELLLDNHTVVRCTPEHLFLLLDGNFKEAINIGPSDRLMPLYRSIGTRGGWYDYEFVWCPVRRERIPTHQLVSRYLKIPHTTPVGHIIHHKDENKQNNVPENLVYAKRGDHAAYHARKRHQEDPEYVAALRKGHENYRLSGGNEKSRENMMRLQREGRIKPARVSAQRNHRILSKRLIEVAEPVWDLTVDKWENFALANGVFVHNSKDVSDCFAAVIAHAEEGFAGGATSQWQEVTTVTPQKRTPIVDEQDALWDKIARGIPLSQAEIEKLK